MLRKSYFFSLAAIIGFLAAAGPVSAQKAGKITRFVAPAFIEQPGARPGLKPVSTATVVGADIHYLDVLRTEDNGRIRAQLNDGSILNLGSHSKLTVKEQDARKQQASFDLAYGQLRSQVQHLTSADSKFEVRTATAVCGVLGTDTVQDADNVTQTVVIVITGVVAVKNSNPNVVGTVTLTAGQFSLVGSNVPPTAAQNATPGQISNAVNNTTGTTNPDPTVTLSTPQVPYGTIFSLNGSASTGGLGTVISYQWSVQGAGGFNYNSPATSNPVFALDTTLPGWSAGAYNGTLTITTDNGKTAKAPFAFTILQPPNVADALTGLAAAYSSLLPGQIAAYFDPSYPGISALTQTLDNVKSNIQSLTVLPTIATPSISGLDATCSATFNFDIFVKPVAPATLPTEVKNAIGTQFTLKLHPDTGKWLITNISANLGAAGFVGVPGSSNPTGGNTPPPSTGAASTGTTNTNTATGVPSPTGTFSVDTPGTLAVFPGGTTPAATMTVTPHDGFTGAVAVQFSLPPGVTFNGPTTIPVGGTSPVTGSYSFNVAQNIGLGPVSVPYTATYGGGAGNGGLTVTGSFALNVMQLSLQVTAGTPSSPVTLFIGNGPVNVTVAAGSNPSGFTGPITLTASSNSSGVSASLGALTNGTATLTLQAVDTNQGASQVAIMATAPGGGSATAVVNVNRVLPFIPASITTPANGQVSVQPGLPANFSIGVPFNAGFTGSITVTAPTVSGVTFTPKSVTLTPGSTTANFQVTSPSVGAQTMRPGTVRPNAVQQSPDVIGNFTIQSGTFSFQVPVNFNIGAAFDFSIGGASLSLVQGGSAGASITITQTAGAAAVPVVVSVIGVPASLNVSGGGTVTGTGSIPLQISASSTAPAGTILSFTVQGVAGSTTHQASVSVAINSAGGFTLSLSSGALTLFAGQPGSVTLNVNAIAPFSGAVSITSTGTGATASGPSSIQAGSSGTYSITPTAASGSVQFTATAGSITQSASLTVSQAVGYTLSVGQVNGFAGGSVPVVVTVNRSGYSGVVTVASAGAPTGVTLSPSSVDVTGTTATFTATLAAGAQAGTVSFTGTAGSGPTASQVLASGGLTIGAPFTLGSGAVNGLAGFAGSVDIAVTPDPSYKGTVTLTAGSLPVGITTGSNTVAVSGGKATFNFTFSAAAKSGSVILTASGTGTTFTSAVTVPITVSAPFTLSPGNDLPVIVPGTMTQGSVSVSINPLLTTPVSVSAGAGGQGIHAALGSTSLSSASSLTSLTVTADPNNSSIGVSTVTVTATAGSYTLTASYKATVQVAYTASASTPTSLSIFRGFTGSIGVAVVANTAFTGTVTASVTGLPSGVTATVLSGANSSGVFSGSTTLLYTVSAAQGSVGPVNAVLNLTGGYNQVAIPFAVTLNDPFSMSLTSVPTQLLNNTPGSYTVQLTPLAGFAGSVQITPKISPAGSAVFGPSTPVTVSASTPVSFTVTVGAGVTGSVTLGAIASAVGGSFTLNQSANTSSSVSTPFNIAVTSPVGTVNVFDSLTSSVAVTVTYQPGYTGTVTVAFAGTNALNRGRRALGRTSNPGAGISYIDGGGNVNGTGSVTFTVVGTGAGSGSLNFTASDNFTNSATASSSYTANYPFTVTAVPNGMIAPFASGTASATVTVTAANGFSGSVNVAAAGSGSAAGALPAGLTIMNATSNPQSISSGGTATFNYTYMAAGSAANGSTNGAFVATGGDGTGTYTAPAIAETLSITAPFTATQTAPDSPVAGTLATYAVTITPATGFGGTVTVTPNLYGTLNAVIPSGPQSVMVPVSTATTVYFTVQIGAGATWLNIGSSVSTGATSPFTVTLNGTRQAVAAPFSLAQTPPTAVVAGTTVPYIVTVNPATGFSGTVTITPSITAVPSGTSGFSASSQTVFVSGSTQVTLSVIVGDATTSLNLGATVSTGPSGNSYSATLTGTNQSVAMPFSATQTRPTSPVAGTNGVYSVTVTPATGFSGTVTVTPTIVGSLSTFSPPSQTVLVSAQTTVTFTVSIGAGATSLNIGSTVVAGMNSNTYTQTLNGYTQTVAVPFTLTQTAPTSPVAGTTVPYTVTITPGTGFSGSVVITPSLTVSPGGAAGFLVSSQTVAVNGVTQVTLSVALSTTATNINLGASVTTGPNGNSYTSTLTGTNQSVAPPFTATATQPVSPVAGTLGSYSVTITPNTGFSGSIVVTPTISSQSSLLPTGAQTVAVSAVTTVSFTVQIGAGATNLNIGSTVAAGGYSVSLVGTNQTPAAPYTLTQTAPTSPVAGTTVPYVVTITPATGFSGSVVISPTITATPNGSSSFQLGSQTVSVTGVTQVTLSVNLGVTATNINLGATVSTGPNGNSYTGTLTGSNQSVLPPFTLSSPMISSPFTGASTGTYSVTVTPNTGFSGTITVGAAIIAVPALSSGFVPSGGGAMQSSISVAVTSGTTVIFTVQLGGMSTFVNITGSASTGGYSASVPAITGSVQAPFVVTQVSPTAPIAGTTDTYRVTVTPNGNFAGTVTVTPTVSTLSTLSPSTPTSLPVAVATANAATFTVTIGAGATTLALGATVSTGTQGTTSYYTTTVAAPVKTPGAPFSLVEVPPTGLIAGTTATYQIQITPNGSFTGGVTVTPTGATGAAVTANITAYRAVTLSVPLDPTAGGTSLSLGSSVTTGPNGNSFTATTSGTSQLVQYPFTLSNPSLTSSINATGTGTYSVTVTPTSGFTGTITVTAAVTSNPANSGGILPSGGSTIQASATVSVSSTTTVNFTVKLNANATGTVSVAGSASVGGYTATVPAQSATVNPAFTVSPANGSLTVFSTQSNTFAITVTPVSTFTGSVSITGPSNGSGLTSVSKSVSGNTTTFTLRADSSNPGSGQSGTLTFHYSESTSGLSGNVTLNYVAIDPFSVTILKPTELSPPVTPVASTTVPYQIVLHVKAGFSGTVKVVPSVVGWDPDASPSPTQYKTVNASSDTDYPLNFNLSIGGGVTSVTLDGDAYAFSNDAFHADAPNRTFPITPAYSIAVSNPTGTLNLFSGFQGTVAVTVTFNGTYNKSVYVSAPGGHLSGLNDIDNNTHTATTSSPTVNYTIVADGTNTTLQSGNLNFNATDNKGNSGSASRAYSVIDPYKISAIPLSSPIASSKNTYSVVVTPNTLGGTTFSGTATVTPQLQGFDGSVSVSPSSIQVPVPSSSTAVFTVTIGGGVDKVSTSATVTTPTNQGERSVFSLSLSTDYQTVSSPFHISAPSNQVVFSSLGTNFSVSVTEGAGYTGTVTVYAPNSYTISRLQGLGTITPSSAVASPGHPAVFVVTGDSSNTNLQHDSFSFSASDGQGNSDSDTASYSVQDPYSISLGLPSRFNRGSNSVSVTLNPNQHFTGSVSVTPSVSYSGSVSISPSGSQTVSVSGSSTVSFTVTFGSSGSNSANFSVHTTTGGFSLDKSQNNISIGGGTDIIGKRGAGDSSRQRVSVIARNETCTGVRLAAGSQSGCGGSVDLEVMPSLTAAGKLRVQLSGGGILDMGVMPLPSSFDPSTVTATSWNTTGEFAQGHVYLVKSGKNLSLVRVSKMRSSVDPRMARTQASVSKSSGASVNSSLLGDMRDEMMLDRALSNAQVEIDLEVLILGIAAY